MKGRALPFMPWWVKDFKADTEALDGEQTGVYALHLMGMWLNNGWLYDDNRALARMGRVSTFKWRRLRPIIMPFYTRIDGNRITQKRLLKELWQSRELTKKPARSVTRSAGQQEFDFEGDDVATRAGARAHPSSHADRSSQYSVLGLAREAAARGLLPPGTTFGPTDDINDLLRKLGIT